MNNKRKEEEYVAHCVLSAVNNILNDVERLINDEVIDWCDHDTSLSKLDFKRIFDNEMRIELSHRLINRRIL